MIRNNKKTRNNMDSQSEHYRTATSGKIPNYNSIQSLSDEDGNRPDAEYLFNTMKQSLMSQNHTQSNKDIQSLDQIYIIINDLKQSNNILSDKCSSLEKEISYRDDIIEEYKQFENRILSNLEHNDTLIHHNTQMTSKHESIIKSIENMKKTISKTSLSYNVIIFYFIILNLVKLKTQLNDRETYIKYKC